VQVIATAGHVDHGKSALVRALTGMEPDRWAEELRRGLTIDLGFAWLTLPGGQRLAFVDVPGHERFVPNMLAGVGPVPAVLFVVAADGGWMPQSAEHLAAVDALGISRGLLVVSRSDLADPGPAMRQAAGQIGRTSLGRVPAVAVSALTGAGLPELRSELAELVTDLPVPDPGRPVRMWVDRVFSVTGSGTVVTGTLPAGTLRAGDELLLTPAGHPVRIRAIESLGEKTTEVSGVARVALNLRGTPVDRLARGMALVQPGGWTMTAVADVRLAVSLADRSPADGPAPDGRRGRLGDRPGEPRRLPREVAVHIGSARTTARVRSFDGPFARLSLRVPLPLHVGDRLLLRDPGPAGTVGTAWAGITGATVLDVSPPPVPRRRAAAAVRHELESWPAAPGLTGLLARHGLLQEAAVHAMGLPPPVTPEPDDPVLDGPVPDDPVPVTAAGWLVDPGHWAVLRERLGQAVERHVAGDPLAIGMPVEAARVAVGLPDRKLVEVLATQPAGPGPRLSLRGGYLSVDPEGATAPAQPLTTAVQKLLADLAASPFRAPEAGRLKELGLDRKMLAAAQRAGLLLRVGPEIVLAPGAAAAAAGVLARLPQPFTTAEARQALGTTRRVAIPLLEYLDRTEVTQRLPDDRRRLRPS
jgi:selenocysteine-specific elongation factor